MTARVIDQERARENLRVACEMMEFGIELMRQNIRRALPAASEDTIASELKRWLVKQPVNFIPTDTKSE